MTQRGTQDQISVPEAVALQRRLSGQVRCEAFEGLPRWVGGADVSCTRNGTTLWGGIVVFDRKQRRIAASCMVSQPTTFPYVPGLLSFRELPVLLEAAAGLELRPDVILVDGQGMAHPRRLGLATHLGLGLDLPTIGCGKTRLVGETRGEPGAARGCRRLLYHRGERVGVLLRTRADVKPMWISPGHRMDIESAARITLACTDRYRLPFPVRAAHQFVGEARRSAARNSAATAKEREGTTK